MLYIGHRVNSVEELTKTPREMGVEVDLRDGQNGRIYISHDPFIEGEDFEDYLKKYNHKTIILNIKSERIEFKALELLKKYNVLDYFFLDSSFPMIKQLVDMGEHNIAIRYSEYEGMEMLRAMQGKAIWTWIDCFSKLPLDKDIYDEIKSLGYKICIVSPELQSQEEKLTQYAQQIATFEVNAICTKEYNVIKWQDILNKSI